jgi:Ni/Co efflux regulator RcnB
MKKFLTFVLILFGASLTVDFVEAANDRQRQIQDERNKQRQMQLERTRQEQIIRDQQRRYEQQKRMEDYQRRKGLPPGGIEGRIESQNPYD